MLHDAVRPCSGNERGGIKYYELLLQNKLILEEQCPEGDVVASYMEQQTINGQHFESKNASRDHEGV